MICLTHIQVRLSVCSDPQYYCRCCNGRLLKSFSLRPEMTVVETVNFSLVYRPVGRGIDGKDETKC
jgi:hypothetical protein